jgi:ubiquinone/menaquinone biosynthesis C-methylase UbiE
MENQNNHVCPWWMGYLLLIPIRKFSHNPEKILRPHIHEGMNVLDYGSAMGYFSLPLATMIGDKGIVFCVDIQEKMLDKLQKRAEKAGTGHIIKPLLIGKNYHPEKLKEQIDFTLLFAVVHEVPDKKNLFSEIFTMSKPGAKVLFAEPKGHVSNEDFERSIQIAEAAGFKRSAEKPMQKGLSVLLVK